MRVYHNLQWTCDSVVIAALCREILTDDAERRAKLYVIQAALAHCPVALLAQI
jgi:hypothetical protein